MLTLSFVFSPTTASSTSASDTSSMPPKVKQDSQFVPVPAVLRLHPFWTASKTLTNVCKAYANDIPYQLYKHLFGKLDQLATRLEDTEGTSSPSAIAAKTLCNQVANAHYMMTSQFLVRTYTSKDRYAALKDSELQMLPSHR